MNSTTPITYRSVGVETDQAEGGLHFLANWVRKSFSNRPAYGKVELPLGYYANVLNLGNNLGLAIATDGVGTKILIAQAMDKLDTIGIDCVAMNVNDIICVGAEPLAMVDYIAVENSHPETLGILAEGLYNGATQAGITLPGGEVAQVKEMIRGENEGSGFDLVGTCVGTVPLDRILIGDDIQDGDIVVGLTSSGIHSNGLTLARRVLLDIPGWTVDKHIPDLGRTIGEELLEPTRIYVKEALSMLKAGLKVKAFAHITSDGFLNLTRVKSHTGYVLDNIPEIPPIFQLIQSHGRIPDAEMFRVFNMGIGFCVVVAPRDVETIQRIATDHGSESYVIGRAISDESKSVQLPSFDLIGREGYFLRASQANDLTN